MISSEPACFSMQFNARCRLAGIEYGEAFVEDDVISSIDGVLE
jgi:hypothetical protein